MLTYSFLREQKLSLTERSDRFKLTAWVVGRSCYVIYGNNETIYSKFKEPWEPCVFQASKMMFLKYV